MYVCKPEDLKEGMILAAPLVTLTNIQLLGKGEAVTARIVQHLKIVRVKEIWVEGEMPASQESSAPSAESEASSEPTASAPLKDVMGGENLQIESKEGLLIRGAVGKGSKVSTLGDLVVRGHIEGAEVNAEGNIHVTESIQGDSSVRSGGRLYAKFINGSKAGARDMVIVRESLVNATVNAGERVILLEENSRIIGGTIKVRAEVVAGGVGSDKGVETDIELSTKGIHNMVVALQKEKKSLEKAHATEKQEYDRLRARESSGLNPNEKSRLAKLREIMSGVEEKTSTIDKQVADLKSKKPDENARLMVKQTVHPGLRVTIGKGSMKITEEQEARLYSEDRGKVVGYPLDQKAYAEAIEKAAALIPPLEANGIE